MLWRRFHSDAGEEAGKDEKRRIGGLRPAWTSAKPATRFFLFLFMATSETRDGARRRACSKLSYSPPYNQAENPEGSLALPLAATVHPYKPLKYTLHTDSVPETWK